MRDIALSDLPPVSLDDVARADHRSRHAERDDGTSDASPFAPEQFVPFDPKTMPPRPWLLGQALLRGSVSGLSAPGGSNKTTLLLQRLIAVRTGRTITGESVWERGPVWYINLEENRDEIRRRIAAMCLAFKVPQEELGTGFLIGAGADTITLAELRDGMAVATIDVERMIATARRHGVVAIGIDPLVQFHKVSENTNEQMAVVMRQCGLIAERTGAALAFAAHSRKGAVAGDPDANRGASAIRDGVRVLETLAPMTGAEAEDSGIPVRERGFFVRLDDAKANYVPPAHTARWFHRVGVCLDNGDGTRPADQVGVLEAVDLSAGAAAATAERTAADETQRQSLAEALCGAMKADRCAVKDLLDIAANHGRPCRERMARRRIEEALPLAPGYRVVKRDGTDWRIYLAALDRENLRSAKAVVRCAVPE